MAHVFGSHTIRNGGIDMAVRRARSAGMRAVQVFTAIPRFYGDSSSIREERVERFLAALDETGIPPGNVLVHAPYVLNLCSHDETKYGRARAGLVKEVERSSAIGARGACFHPGSATGGDVAAAVRAVGEAMTEALEATDSETCLYVENTAGAGRTVGRTPEEVAGILEHVGDHVRHRAGYGLDTCHLFASGHDISASPDALGDVLDGFESATGEPPSFFHLNDSEGELGSNRDRHRLLGEGEIGEAPFGWLLADPRSHDIPLILETPRKNADIADDDPAADPYDLRMMELLETLSAAVDG